MSRISLLLVAAAVAAGVVGCAQCDTCDDFPAPCTGPNCGQNQNLGGVPGLAPTMSQGAPVMGVSTPGNPPMDDSAGPGPDAPPPATRSPATPPVDPTSPPSPMEPAPKPN
jgi:hypothetical protein